jgi:predicted transcriptional regulator
MGVLWYNPIMDTGQQPHKVTVDIPQDVWEAVRELARAHQRSFVKELVWALQEYVRRERRKGAARAE